MRKAHANEPDEVLARETGRGDLDAFDELVRRYEHRIYGFVLQFVSNPTDAREVTQDAFLGGFVAINQYRPGSPFASWLFAIARNKAIDHLRSHKEATREEVPENPDYDDPAVLTVRREDKAEIWERARKVLPELHFQAVWLRYVEDMDVAGIAAVLGKTKTHVKVLLFRARRLLAASLRAAPAAAGGPEARFQSQHVPEAAVNNGTPRRKDLGTWTLDPGTGTLDLRP
jgi:RNA polymerase sigma-70 factor (ECF subfamily)